MTFLRLPRPGFPWSSVFLPQTEPDQIISLRHSLEIRQEAEQTCRYLSFNFYLQIVSSQCLSAWISSSYRRDYNRLTKRYYPCITRSNLSGGFCKWLKNRVKSLALGLIGIKSGWCLKKHQRSLGGSCNLEMCNTASLGLQVSEALALGRCPKSAVPLEKKYFCVYGSRPTAGALGLLFICIPGPCSAPGRVAPPVFGNSVRIFPVVFFSLAELLGSNTSGRAGLPERFWFPC